MLTMLIKIKRNEGSVVCLTSTCAKSLQHANQFELDILARICCLMDGTFNPPDGREICRQVLEQWHKVMRQE